MSEYIFKFSMNNPEIIENDGVTTVRMGTELQERIVRCRDCEYYDHWDASGRYREKHVCGHWDCLEIKPDGFCAWGERKERVEQ